MAIPRVLWWFRLWPFWKTFFEGLGCRVVTNDPARPTPRHHDRASTIVEEACFPIQLLLDRTLAIAGQADMVFMPRLISIVPRGIMCPRFTGVPDIVQMVLGPDRRVLAPVIDARLGRSSIRNAYLEVAAQLGALAAVGRQAFRRATAMEAQFEAEFEMRLNQLPTPDVFDPQRQTGMAHRPGRRQDARPTVPDRPPGQRNHSQPSTSMPRVALLGHPYIAFDWEFNLELVQKLRNLGLWIVPVESIPRKRIESSVRRLDKNVYWSSGREVLGAALSFFENGGIDGLIYLSCFKCGVDGLLLDVVRWAARHQSQVAYLSLTLDGHDNEMGLVTRLEAFADIVRRRARKTN